MTVVRAEVATSATVDDSVVGSVAHDDPAAGPAIHDDAAASGRPRTTTPGSRSRGAAGASCPGGAGAPRGVWGHVGGLAGRVGRTRDGVPVAGNTATAVQDVAITRLAAIEEEWLEDGTVVERTGRPVTSRSTLPTSSPARWASPTCTRSAEWASRSDSWPT